MTDERVQRSLYREIDRYFSLH